MRPRHERRIAHAETILRAAIAAADPAPAVAAAVRSAGHLANARRVHVVALGKAAVRMCQAALASLARAPESCLIVAPHGGPRHGFIDCRLLTGAHPVPDAASVRAGEAVAAVLQGADADDVVVMLLSGGASAVCALPVPGVSIEAYAHVVGSLLRAGADIHELNTVRRHSDILKGGGMAALAAPARVLGLIVSDVPHDDIAVIASGPVSPAPTRAADALRILETRGLLDTALERAISAGESPAPDVFERVVARVIQDNAAARRAAAACARDLGYETMDTSAPITGEARVQGAQFAQRVAALDEEAAVPMCIIAGGETTVTVTGEGHGGRNQEFTLAAALALPAASRAVIGSAGTDGVDGPTDAAGAVADAESVASAIASGIDPQLLLADNDSHTFFRRVGGHIITGPTGTNVMDLVVGLAGPYD